MGKNKETVAGTRNVICPNPACGRAFASPLKAQNLSSDKAKSYDACPYCLAEIAVEEPVEASDVVPSLQSKEPEDESEEQRPAKEELNPNPPKVEGCQHHFGYLSSRATKENIPDECITCQNIVKCMLKTVTG